MEKEIKLNAMEQAAVNKMPTPEMQKQFADALLNAKREADAKLRLLRDVFGVEVNELGTVVIRGLGNRFPTGLRPDSLQKLLDNSEALRKAIVEARAYIVANPEKIKAAQAKRTAERKLNAKASKLGQEAIAKLSVVR